MKLNDLENIADAVVRRAERQGFVVAREMREELAEAGLARDRWKDVVSLARASLRYHRGRYYHAATVSDRVLREQDQQRDVRRAVCQIVRAHRASSRAVERRGQVRFEFIQPVKVRTEDGREFALLSRDLSATGIRLIGTRRLLGQKVTVHVPRPDGTGAAGNGAAAWSFVVRVLWTCAVGEDLFENGGVFLDVSPALRAERDG
jgi:hypothetical protein